jgi:hypothetical protein
MFVFLLVEEHRRREKMLATDVAGSRVTKGVPLFRLERDCLRDSWLLLSIRSLLGFLVRCSQAGAGVQVPFPWLRWRVPTTPVESVHSLNTTLADSCAHRVALRALMCE